MKRKLTIAAGIIHEPEILFLDEPTTGIDVSFARQIRKLIGELHRKGTTIFLTTHYIEEAERLCQRLAFIVRGKIVREGTVEGLMREAQEGNMVNFTLGGDFSALREEFERHFPGCLFQFGRSGSEVSVHSSSTIALFPLVKLFEEKKMPVYEAKIVRPSLEEVFVKTTGLELQKMQEQQNRKGWKGVRS